ncbi:hypothetical protein [Mucilaginibacter aquatilis]|uniref:Uncharacterized protein n=1 Tax=Mucilaginibacter aquatilis TaxID=1517760 RepID=A0A6I4I3M1_9SPHI|nr:hypothetical protein [Mucilaginibacter aquatilis]MVN89610.1 hypothetical protein [Mucilaginibacter aquatilis]
MDSNTFFDDAKKATKDLNESVKELDQVIKQLKSSQSELSETLQKTTKDFEANVTSINKNKQAIDDLNKKIAHTAKVIDTSSNTLNNNKELMDGLLKKYDKLKETHANNSKAVRDLKLEIVNLSGVINDQENELKKSSKTFDYHKESIDAVKKSIDVVKKSTDAVKNHISDLKEHGKSFGPEFASTIEDASKGFNAMKDGLAHVKTGFQSVGGAIKTTGFGLLLLVLESITEYFTKSPKGIEQFRQFLAGLGVVVNTVKENISKFKLAIVEAFTNPVEGLKKLGKLIEDNILNRLKAFGVMYEGLINKDFKKFASGMVQLATGTTDAFKKVEKAITDNSDKALEQKAIHDKAEAEKKKKQEEEAKKRADANEKRRQEREAQRKADLDKRRKHNEEVKKLSDEAKNELIESKARMAQNLLQGFAKEISDTDAHFQQLKNKYKGHKQTIEQIEKEHVASIEAINKKFREEDSKTLDGFHKELRNIGMSARQQAQVQLDEEYNEKKKKIEDIKQKNDEIILNAGIKLTELEAAPLTATSKLQIESLKKQQSEAQKIYNDASGLLTDFKAKHETDSKGLNDNFDKQDLGIKETKLQESIANEREGGHESAAIKKEQELLKLQHDVAKNAAEAKGKETTLIEAKYAKQKADLEDKLTSSRIHAGDKLIDAVLKNTKKDSAIYKAAFLAKKATSIADTIISTKQSIMESLKAYSGIPFIGQALGIAQAAFMAVQGATSIAEIAKQKPGMAQGGQFISDGRGAVLPGYSRTDNTNAYLRSGEAVVVSEAMRNPWARNMVSAINVAYGGRDFSVPNAGSGYAIGGVFTDGGNASRYYSQPVNDQKDLANTLAYQMLNNFPPIYVDVKDVNNQQNILVQTVNRVNL